MQVTGINPVLALESDLKSLLEVRRILRDL